jgi:hypothetical protein
MVLSLFKRTKHVSHDDSRFHFTITPYKQDEDNDVKKPL